MSSRENKIIAYQTAVLDMFAILGLPKPITYETELIGSTLIEKFIDTLEKTKIDIPLSGKINIDLYNDMFQSNQMIENSENQNFAKKRIYMLSYILEEMKQSKKSEYNLIHKLMEDYPNYITEFMISDINQDLKMKVIKSVIEIYNQYGAFINIEEIFTVDKNKMYRKEYEIASMLMNEAIEKFRALTPNTDNIFLDLAKTNNNQVIYKLQKIGIIQKRNNI